MPPDEGGAAASPPSATVLSRTFQHRLDCPSARDWMFSNVAGMLRGRVGTWLLVIDRLSCAVRLLLNDIASSSVLRTVLLLTSRRTLAVSSATVVPSMPYVEAVPSMVLPVI